MFIAIKILSAIPGLVHRCKVVEIETTKLKLVEAYAVLPIRVEFHQDTPVLSKRMVHAPHITRFVAVHSVVIGDPAGIGTELLIGASSESDAAFKAVF